MPLPLPPSAHPIGLFDSGVGGLSIWEKITEILPHESTLYLADLARCPYGPRPCEEIITRCDRITRFLLEQNCKLIVVACNTATGFAIDTLRQRFPIPFVGIEPGIKPAALHSHTGRIGVLATTGTCQGRLFQETTTRFANPVQVLMAEGTGLVERVERGETDSPATEQLLRQYLEPMLAARIDHLVLGCTHYPFLEKPIRRIIGPDITLVTTGTAVAHRTRFLLEQHNLLNSHSPTTYRFLATAPAPGLSRLLQQMNHLTPIETIPDEITAP